jgi:regulator of replication initiation timing
MMTMALKLFAKQSETAVEADVSDASLKEGRAARLEKQVEEMAQEMSRLKTEVETMVARQQGFRLALRRLREYLEERGVQERTPAEAKEDASAPANLQQAIARKDKSNLH